MRKAVLTLRSPKGGLEVEDKMVQIEKIKKQAQNQLLRLVILNLFCSEKNFTRQKLFK